MKERIKKVFKNKYFRKTIMLLLILLVIREIYNIYVDIYNFKQLEKAKIVLDKLPKDDYKFYTLQKFNDKYNAGIKPMKNCYFISNDNGEQPYIFGFKLESLMYKLKYFSFHYVYPKYNLPIVPDCPGPSGKCIDDGGYYSFKNRISSPCRD